MSEYKIPFHIQEEIMKRLPVKLLVQFRSVSKAWKSLIDSSDFIAVHTLLSHTQPHHLLVSLFYQDPREEGKFVSYMDDETFPHQKSLLTLPPPLSTKQIIHPKVVGSSHGLVCLCGTNSTKKTETALLWNPSIRKYIVVDMPAKTKTNGVGVGFGVCPVTNDPKILFITQSSKGDIETKAMVYPLSSKKWTSLSTNLPNQQIRDPFGFVVTDRFIYWCALSQTHYMIMSFDVTGETFEAIDLPDSLAGYFYIAKLRELLAILQYDGNIYTVWMMEHGVQRSFTKMFTITTTGGVVGFRKNGIPIVQVRDHVDEDDEVKLVVYEPTLDHNSFLEMSFYQFNVKSYMETLLLLGRSDCISY